MTSAALESAAASAFANGLGQTDDRALHFRRKRSDRHQRGRNLLRATTQIGGAYPGQKERGVGAEAARCLQIFGVRRALAGLVQALRGRSDATSISPFRLFEAEPFPFTSQAFTKIHSFAKNPVDTFRVRCFMSASFRKLTGFLNPVSATNPHTHGATTVHGLRLGIDLDRLRAVRARLQERGVSDWARANGFRPKAVHDVLSGTRVCTRGKSHQIALALGLKDPADKADQS